MESNMINVDNRKNTEREKSYMAFFQDDYKLLPNEVQVILADFIQNKNFNKFSNELKRKRNLMIYLCAIQILASCMGMAYMVFRRSYIYLVINLITFTLALSGGLGSILMNYLLIIIHCIFTISLPGGFFLYQIVDFFVATEPGNNNNKRASEALIFIIFSIPYIYDLAAGIFCFIFLKEISKNLKEIHQDYDIAREEYTDMKQKYSKKEINEHFKSINENICVICMDERRDTALSPCGHYLCCNKCAENLFRKFSFRKPKCPICRKECESFMKIILS